MLKGSIVNNELDLVELNNEKVTGKFNLKLKDNKLIGKWQNPEGSKIYPCTANLINKYNNENILIFTKLIQYRYEKLKNEINLPKIYILNNKGLESKINEKLSVEKLITFPLNEIKEMYEANGSGVTISGYRINLLTKNILSIESFYEYLGAGLNHHYIRYNISLKNGEILKEDELFKEKENLIKYINNKIEVQISKSKKELTGEELETFNEMISNKYYVIKKLNKFSLLKEGIEVQVDFGFPRVLQYISPPTIYLIKYNEIEDYLKFEI